MLLGLIVLALIPATIHAAYRWALSTEITRSYRAAGRAHNIVVVGSVLLGLGIALSDPVIRDNLGPGRLVDQQGIWAMDWRTFLVERGEPLGHVVGLFVREAPINGWVAALLAASAAAISAACVILASKTGRGEVTRDGCVVLVVVVTIVFQTIYLTMFAAYLVNILNFWSFVLWILVIQYFRKEKHNVKMPHRE